MKSLTNMKLTQLLKESAVSYVEADIPVDSFDQLKHEIDKINRRANKLGAPPVSINVTGTKYINHKSTHGTTYKTKVYTVSLTGEPPTIPGYEFLATIQHKGAGNVIRMVPGKDETGIEKFYNARPDYCDHCKKVRHRIDTFIIKGKNGDLRQIGRNCLKDFLGGVDPKKILFQLSYEKYLQDAINGIMGSGNDGETGPRQSRGERLLDVDVVLTAAAAFVIEWGYQKRDYEYGSEATADKVKKILFYDDDRDEELRTVYKKNHEKAEKLATNALSWFNGAITDAQKQQNNYYHSIDTIIKSGDVSARDVGILSSLIAAFNREANKNSSPADKQKSNEWVGNVGDKLPPTKVTTISTRFIENNASYYAAPIQVCKFEDDDGNSYTWFNSSSTEIEDGMKYTIVGKIKKHDEYKGRKTTNLSHVKAIPES